MYEILGSLSGKAYNEMISLLVHRCDSFIFHLPNMGKLMINERNAKFLSSYPVGYSKEENQNEHREYVDRVDKFLDVIKNDIVRDYTDTGYLDQVSSIEMRIYHVSISSRTKHFFELTDNFSNWRYPSLPENPCFLSKGKCIFQCIAHENLCFIYSDDKEFELLLKRNRIEFVQSGDLQTPRFEG